MKTLNMPDGLYLNFSMADYEAIDRTRFSWLKEMKRSPAHYRHRSMQPREETDALTLGEATHLASFLPEKYRARYVVWDGFRRAGKEWEKFKVQAEGQGQKILTEEMNDKAKAIANAVRNNRLSSPWLDAGKGELSLLWTSPENNDEDVQIKSRLDFVSDAGAIVDLKTCRDANPSNFEKAAWNYGYFEQAAMYQDGYYSLTGKKLPYIILAVENVEPYVMTRFVVPDKWLRLGRDSYRSWLWRLVESRRTNNWWGYTTETVDLNPPSWAAPQNDDDPSGMDLVIGG